MHTMLLALATAGASHLFQGTAFSQFCAGPPSGGQLYYISSVFQLPKPGGIAMQDAFAAELKKRYGYTGVVTCYADISPAGSEARHKSYIDRANGQGAEVTAVNWKYDPAAEAAKAAAEAAATPTPPAPPPPPPGGYQPPKLEDFHVLMKGLDHGALTSPWRERADSGLALNKQWCQMNTPLSGAFDCDAFTKVVFKYRVAHAQDYHPYRGGQDNEGWDPLGNLFYRPDFKCGECTTPERLAHWADSLTRANMEPHPGVHSLSYAKIDEYAKCSARKIAAEFAANPLVYQLQPAFNRTQEACNREIH